MEERKYYVYALIDSSGDTRYIGQGCGARLKKRQGRDKEYLSILDEGGYTSIIKDNLTKLEALEEERLLLNKHDKDKLLNKVRGITPKYIDFNIVSKYVEYCESSRTKLIWLVDLPRVHTVNAIKRIGKPAGSNGSKNRYGKVVIEGTAYPIHRVIWVITNKQDLDYNFVINHIDGDIKNNNKENLEKCSTKENNLLRTKAVKNRALPTGVYLQTDGNGFSRYSSGYAKRDGKYKTKSFSCGIYGESQALAMAISWRKSMLEQEYPELNIPLIKDFSNLEKMDYRIYIVQNYHTNKVELITGDIIKAEEKINYNDELCIKFIDIDLMLLEEIH